MQKQWVVQGQMWNGVVIEGAGVPIVILHGWGRTHQEWIAIGRQINRISGRSVYCLDLPGFGGSTLPSIKDTEEYAFLLNNWLEYEGIKQTSIVGHSLGGRVGIVMAAMHPGIVEQLVLIDAAGVRSRSIKRAALKGIAKLFVWVPQSIRRKAVAGLMDEDYRNSPTLRELYRAVVKTDLTPYLAKIKAPTTVVWGERDPLLPLTLTKIYRKLIATVKVRVVWEAGHDPHLTHPRELTRILEEVWT